MATNSDQTTINGTKKNDIIGVPNQKAQLTVNGLGGDDIIEQPTGLYPLEDGSYNQVYLFDGGPGTDGVNLTYVSGVVSLTFTATRKAINTKGQVGLEVKIDGPAEGTTSNWNYHATLINCEYLSIFTWNTYYGLLDPYFRILGITGPQAFILAETNAIDSNQIVVRSIYYGGVYKFGTASDVVDFQSYQINADLGGGNDIARLAAGYSGVSMLNGGPGTDIFVVVPGNKQSALAYRAVYDDMGNGALLLAMPLADIQEASLTNFEYIVFDNVTVRIIGGTIGADRLRGIAGTYGVIAGYEGNDTLIGVTSGDTLLGGPGNDLLIAGTGSSYPRNILANGGFEKNSAAARRYIFTTSLKGWTSLVQTGDTWTSGGQFKLWKAMTSPEATEGKSYLELDTNNNVNGIAQSVQTAKGQIYKLTFDLAARQKDAIDTVNVYWAGARVGTFSNLKNEWTSFTYFVKGTGTMDSLQFSEDSKQNDGSGVLLDNIGLTPFTPKDPGTTNVLQGGTGRDTMVGSAVVDRFVFRLPEESGTTAETADVIRQFTSGTDVVDISNIIKPGDMNWSSGKAFTGTLREVIVTNETVDKKAGLLASFDIDGNRQADFAIFFEGLNSLSASDFGMII